MGAAFVSTDPRYLGVAPGSRAEVVVVVRNIGECVDQLSLEVLGDAARWSRVEPAELRLLPDQDGAATVVFEPPRDPSVPSGPVPFGIRAHSHEEPARGAVDEGVLEVHPFVDISAELVPRSVRGRRRARAELAVDNRGNAPMNLDAHGADADGALRVDVKEAGLQGAPGTATFARVDLAPRRTFWKGPPRTIPFKVALEGTGNGAVVVDGTMVQEPLLPKWFWKAVVAALLAILALVLLWYLVLKPTVESVAQEAAAEEVENQVDQITAEAEERAAAASGGAGATPEVAGATPEEVAEAATEAGQAAAADALAEAIENGSVITVEGAIDFRLGEGTPDGLSRSFSDSVFSMTDIVFQNPREDSGTVRVLRGGEVLLEVGLDNFRDLDYHYVTPLRFDGQDVVIEVTCANEDGRSCTPAVSFTGVEAPQET